MSAHRIQHSHSRATEAFETRDYLLNRYGLRMTKRDVVFESKDCRAAIDNARSAQHATFDDVLAAAQVDKRKERATGSRVLFHTVKIAAWLDGKQASADEVY